MSQLYRSAGDVLRNLERKNGSLKSLVFTSQSTDLRTKKKLYAILCKTLKYKEILSEVITSCKLMDKAPQLANSHHLCLVLVCDFLYGKGIRCGGPLKSAIMQHAKELKLAWESLQDSFDSCTSEHLTLPKYVRINTLKGNSEDLLRSLEEQGFSKRTQGEVSSCSCLSQNKGGLTMKNCFCEDAVIPGLLMFCQCTSLVDSKLYLESRIIIQDKASCLPAYVLSPPSGSRVIDSCAAPGNKTTHLSSIMQNQGLIYAFDKDPKRYKTLQSMVRSAGATNVIMQCDDFLTVRIMLQGCNFCSCTLFPSPLWTSVMQDTLNISVVSTESYGLLWLQVDPKNYGDVTAILVDPSCSGSGIYNRLSYDKNESKDLRRLAQLSKFQCQMLNHALSFPGVLKVVYSTCSIHKEENEFVVRKALLTNASSFDLVHVLPDWPSRGLPVFTKAECCIRASAGDKTNGFFVAMFQRCPQEHNQ